MGKLLGRVSVVVALGIVAFCCGDSFGAPLVIDDFTVGSGVAYTSDGTVRNPGPPPSNTWTLSDGPMAFVGVTGSRTNFLTVDTDPGNAVVNASGNVGLGAYSVGFGDALGGDAKLQYTFTSPNLLDLSGYATISLSVRYDVTASESLNVSLTIGDGVVHTETVMSVNGQSGFVPMEFALADFAGAGVDLSNIASIVLAGTPTLVGSDFTFRDFQAQVTPIPEPFSAGIWSLIGVIGLIYGMRRARN